MKSPIIDRYGYEPLPPGLIIDRQVKDMERISAVLRRVLKRSGINAKRVCACVSSNHVVSKVVTVQSELDDDELEAMVEIEAERVSPYELTELNIDYARLGPDPRSPSEDAVQIVACRRNAVEDLTGILELGGLEPVIMDVDLYALANVNQFVNGREANGGRGTTAIVDFGLDGSRLMVFHNDMLIYNRDTPLGGRQLVEGVQRKYGIPAKDGFIAVKQGKLPRSYKQEVLKPFVRTLVQEMLRSLQFFFSTAAHAQIDRLAITGGCARIGNIDKIMQQKLEIPTTILNPFQHMKPSSKVDKAKLKRDIPYLGLVCGLAMRGFE